MRIRSIRRRCVARIVFALLFVGLVFAASADFASAHARLVTSDPAAGSALTKPPALIKLTYSETIDLESADLTLLDADGNTVALTGPEPVPGQDAMVTTSISDPDALAPAVYTLVWRVLSTSDGHVTSGSVAFSVGTGVAPSANSSSENNRPPWWSVFARWVELCGLIGVAGLLFAVTVHRNTVTNLSDQSLTQQVFGLWRHLWLFSVGIALGGMALGLWAQARWSEGADAGIIPAATSFRTALTDTRYGEGWIARIVVVAVLMILLDGMWEKVRPWRWIVASLLGLGALALLSGSGHAAAEPRANLAIADDLIHLSGVSFWLGGLVLLVLALKPLDHAGDQEAVAVSDQLVSRHSNLALLTVIVIAVTGVVSAQFHVSGPTALQTEDYGLALLGKLGLVVLVLAVAAVNLLIWRPRIRYFQEEQNTTETAKQLDGVRSVSIAELVIAVFILAVTAALSQLPPADGPMPVEVAAKAVTVDQHETAGDLDVWLFAELRGEPTDRYTITVTDQNGDVPPDMQRVIVRSTLPPEDADTTQVQDRFDADPLETGSGAYAFAANRLGLEGKWNLDILVRRAGLEDVDASFVVDTTGTAQPPPRLVEDAWRMPHVPAKSYGYFAIAVVMLLIGLIGIRKLTHYEPLSSGVLLVMSILIAVGFIVSGLRQTVSSTPDSGLVNPIALDSVIAKSGKDLYFANCAVCHGPAGKGGDTTGDPAHNHGSAGNLLDDGTRLQSDGDLYYWISRGVINSEMPAFDVALTEQQRWTLVHYLRLLQGEDESP